MSADFGQGRLWYIQGDLLLPFFQKAIVKTQVGIHNMVATRSGVWFAGDGCFTLYEACLSEHRKILRHLHVREAARGFDLFGSAGTVGDGSEYRHIVMWIGDKILQQQTRLRVHQIVRAQQLSEDVFGHRLALCDAFPVGRYAAEYRVDQHPVRGGISGEVSAGYPEG